MTDISPKSSITGGLDIGNGYVKGVLRSSLVVGPDGAPRADRFDMPSGVAIVTRPADLPFPDAEATRILEGVPGAASATSATSARDVFNELDASFTSPLVTSSYRHLFGARGLHAKASRFDEFDLVTATSKVDQQLSFVLVLGLFAAKALRDQVELTGEVPTSQLEVEARVGLALPINEYRAHRARYAAMFKEGVHLVTLHNFETPVVVKVRFADVRVVAEGASAQFAITSRGPVFVESLLADARAAVAASGSEAAAQAFEGVTAEAVSAAMHTIGIDIGEGTVNFPVYTDGAFNSDVSTTFEKGYGTVLLRSMDTLRQAKVPFRSRKQLADYLLRTPSPMKRLEHEKVVQIVDAEAQLFAEEVVEAFARVHAEASRDTEVAYVYGGGSGPMSAHLRPLLDELVDGAFPVLHLDASYSRHLNREGLLLAAAASESAASAAAQAAQSKKPKQG